MRGVEGGTCSELWVPGGVRSRDVSPAGGFGGREDPVGEKTADYPSALGGWPGGGGQGTGAGVRVLPGERG